MNSKSRLLISFIAVFILALALAACGGEEPTATPEPPPPTAEPAPTDMPEPTDEPDPSDVPELSD